MVLFIQKALPFFSKQVHNHFLKWYKPLNTVRMQMFHLFSISIAYLVLAHPTLMLTELPSYARLSLQLQCSAKQKK